MKKFAVVVSGWHFPLHFYQEIAKQHIPEGWQMDLFCVSHRDPSHAVEEKKAFLKGLGRTYREKLDRVLYKKVATKEDIEALGWKYTLEPNTIGDWGNTNQWLEKNDYKEYEFFLFSHDDNLILTREMFSSIILQKDYDDWLIYANTPGMPRGNLRGSFEFFKREMLDIMGGKFDLSMVTTTREGKTDNPDDLGGLMDWNNVPYPLTKLIHEKGLVPRIYALAPGYRVSAFCIEGERGYISKTHGINTEVENHGIKVLKKHKMINV